MATNSEIQKNIENQLFWDDRLSDYDIDVTVTDGMVTLSGKVHDRAALKVAETDAYLIEGVHAVNNLLMVEVPKEKKLPTDEEIKFSVIRALSWNNRIDATNIEVEVENGNVKVRGAVSAYWKKLLTEDIIFSINGVINVVNELTVVPSKDTVDKMIADEIISAMERNFSVEPENIDVKVNNGIVTLSGMVDNRISERAAYETALYTPGVIDIKNKITVRSI